MSSRWQLIADTDPARDPLRHGLRGEAADIVTESVWVPGGLALFTTLWMLVLVIINPTGEAQIPGVAAVTAAVVLPIVAAAVVVAVRRRLPWWRAALVVVGAPSRGYGWLIKRLVGRFLTGFVVVTGIIGSILLLVVLVAGALTFRTGANQYGTWVRGINPVWAIVIGLVVLLVFFVWVLCVLVAVAPYWFGVMGVMTWTAIQVSDGGPGADTMMMYAIPVCLLLLFWIPSSVTWVMGQLAPNQQGVLVLPRFHLVSRTNLVRQTSAARQLREGRPVGPGTRLLTVLVVIGNCLVSIPMGPFLPIREWTAGEAGRELLRQRARQ
ncbi:MAG: hypothetical protein ACTH2Q_06840 [Propionibacteriaceae bacterium]